MSTSEQPEDRADVLSTVLAGVRAKLNRTLASYRIPLEDASDLVHDAVERMLREWEEIFDHEGWLVATVRFNCLAYWRRHRRRLAECVDEELIDLLVEPGPSPDRQVELARDLDRVLACVSERCRHVLRLRYQYGFRPNEVADEMGYQPSSIQKITRRCVTALTRELARSGYRGAEEGMHA